MTTSSMCAGDAASAAEVESKESIACAGDAASAAEVERGESIR